MSFLIYLPLVCARNRQSHQTFDLTHYRQTEYIDEKAQSSLNLELQEVILDASVIQNVAVRLSEERGQFIQESSKSEPKKKRMHFDKILLERDFDQGKSGLKLENEKIKALETELFSFQEIYETLKKNLVSINEEYSSIEKIQTFLESKIQGLENENKELRIHLDTCRNAYLSFIEERDEFEKVMDERNAEYAKELEEKELRISNQTNVLKQQNEELILHNIEVKLF